MFFKYSVFFITHSSVLSAFSSGGISSSSSHGQLAPPFPLFCLPTKSGRELWDEWNWATSANTASEFVAVVGVVGAGLSMLTSVLVSFVMSSLMPLSATRRL